MKYQQGGRPKGESTQLVRVPGGCSQGGLVSAPAFSEPLILYRMTPGRRDFTGQWIPGVFLESAVEGVALPVEGDERLVLPESLRGKNTKWTQTVSVLVL